MRKQRGMSQEDLAYELSISRQAISKWENGETQPTADNLMGLSDCFGIPIDELVNCASAKNKETAATSDDKLKKKRKGIIIAAITVSTVICVICSAACVIAIYFDNRISDYRHNTVFMHEANLSEIICGCVAGVSLIAIIVLIIVYVVKCKKSK